MATIGDILSVLRRRIGDTDLPYTFTDDLLYGYIADAVSQVELEYQRDFNVTLTVDNGTTTASFDGDKVPNPVDVQLFAVKAHYLVKLRTKDKADRDNFLMRKGRLTLDNTNQAADHAETLKIIDAEYKRVLYQAKNGSSSIQGIRME